jgi:hypothetical protein
MLEGSLLYFWKNLGNIPWDDSLFSTYKRRTSPSSFQQQTREEHPARARATPLHGLRP